MTVFSVLAVISLVVLLLLIPSFVIYRDLRTGRSDPTFHDNET